MFGFRSRKRKASPDKRADKSKKLKVSSRIFRGPTNSKTNSEAKSKLSKLLPEGYDSIILTANTRPVDSFAENEAVFGCVRLPILTKEEAMVWIKKFERQTFTTYRTQKTWKKDDNTGLFKRKYICNVKDALEAVDAVCKGSIIFTIKDQEEIQANPDYYLRDYPSQVIIHFCHNHKIDPENYMKNLRPSAELRIIFGTYFANGHSPFSALICHKCDLHSSYGEEYYNVVSDDTVCPSYNWCFHEYENFFMRRFVDPSEDTLNEKLKETVRQYNAKCRSECAVISEKPLFILSICTPLMKNIFRSGFAEELITVRCFSTPKTVPKRQKLILFLCHTPIGSLPFGIIINFVEDKDNLCEGIRALIKMLGNSAYSPKIVITDENDLVRNSLQTCFPTSQVVFNEFQLLQSIWRINRIVCMDDNEEFQALYNLFLVALNSSSEEEFKRNFDSLLVYAERYPKLSTYLKYFKFSLDSYVRYARPKIEFDTDVLNYTDSGTIILQDVSIKYGNFFNIVQLFDFLTKSYMNHYERKLSKIVQGNLKGFFKTNFYVPLSKITDFSCEKISDTEFLVGLNQIRFFVNAELDTCTCQVGVHGGSCVHQYIVEKNLGLVPECYTPLCDDMLSIFKNMLKGKTVKRSILNTECKSELDDGLDSAELESSDLDNFSDIVSSGCSESNFGETPREADYLGPVDEIFSAEPDINYSFTDFSAEIMSQLVLNEFDNTNEANEAVLDNSEQYNDESGVKPVDSSHGMKITKHFESNILVETSKNLNPKMSTPEKNPNPNVYEFSEDGINCNKEIEVVNRCVNEDESTLVPIPVDGPMVLKANVESDNITDSVTSSVGRSVVYSYSEENRAEMDLYVEVMTENDKKTAEIAEFLTNLPDTNNFNNQFQYAKGTSIIHNLVEQNKGKTQIVNRTILLDNVHDESKALKPDQQCSSNGVLVVRNEEYFTNHQVLENKNLSVVSDDKFMSPCHTENHISNHANYEKEPQSASHNLITDSYEESNLIMMSPNDLFDDNQNVEPDTCTGTQEIKINVLSSVVIKPPINLPTNNSHIPLNLNVIKHKTLRNVKEDSRSRIGEQKIDINSGNTVFVHDPLKLEPRKIILPIVSKEEICNALHEKASDAFDPEISNQTLEKDVIKLYCNQSGEKSFSEDRDVKDNKAIKKEKIEEDTEFPSPKQSNYCSQGLKETMHIRSNFLDSETHVSDSENMTIFKEDGEHESDSEACSQQYLDISDCDDTTLPDCDPEELAKTDYVEIIDIDSDDLDELASQNYDSELISSDMTSKSFSLQNLVSKSYPIKVIPLEKLPSKILPIKCFSPENNSVSNPIPLKDFMKKMASPRESLQLLSLDTVHNNKNYYPVKASSENEMLEEQLKMTFSQLENLMGRESFKESVDRFLNSHNSNSNSDKQTRVRTTEITENIENRKNVKYNLRDNNTFEKSLKDLQPKISEISIKNRSEIKPKYIHRPSPALSYSIVNREKISHFRNKSISDTKIATHAKDMNKLKTSEDQKCIDLNSTIAGQQREKNIYNKLYTKETESGDTSESFDSFPSGLNDLSEDEIYELQYLSDENTCANSYNDRDSLNTVNQGYVKQIQSTNISSEYTTSKKNKKKRETIEKNKILSSKIESNNDRYDLSANAADVSRIIKETSSGTSKISPGIKDLHKEKNRTSLIQNGHISSDECLQYATKKNTTGKIQNDKEKCSKKYSQFVNQNMSLKLNKKNAKSYGTPDNYTSCFSLANKWSHQISVTDRKVKAYEASKSTKNTNKIGLEPNENSFYKKSQRSFKDYCSSLERGDYKYSEKADNEANEYNIPIKSNQNVYLRKLKNINIPTAIQETGFYASPILKHSRPPRATLENNMFTSKVGAKFLLNDSNSSGSEKIIQKDYIEKVIDEMKSVSSCQSISSREKPLNEEGKDTKDLESVVASDFDINLDIADVDYKESAISQASILRNKDLAFLFDDPRFETVIDDGSGVVEHGVKKGNSGQIPLDTGNSYIKLVVFANLQNYSTINAPSGQKIGCSESYIKPSLLAHANIFENKIENINPSRNALLTDSVVTSANDTVGNRTAENNRNKLMKHIPCDIGKDESHLVLERFDVECDEVDRNKPKSESCTKQCNNSEMKSPTRKVLNSSSVNLSYEGLTKSLRVFKTDLKKKVRKSDKKSKDIDTILKFEDDMLSRRKTQQNIPKMQLFKNKQNVTNSQIIYSESSPEIKIMMKDSFRSQKNTLNISKSVENKKAFRHTSRPNTSTSVANGLGVTNLDDTPKKKYSFTSCPAEYPVKLSIDNPTRDPENDDFESSITASILEKQHTTKDTLKSKHINKKDLIASSASKKSIGYEDEFKNFLENSHRLILNKEPELSGSDIESSIEKTDCDRSKGSTKRSKSVSDTKELRGNDVPRETKKSVSWADGLRVIEYKVETSESDSEIEDMSKSNSPDERKQKRNKLKYSIFSSPKKRRIKSLSPTNQKTSDTPRNTKVKGTNTYSKNEPRLVVNLVNETQLATSAIVHERLGYLGRSEDTAIAGQSALSCNIYRVRNPKTTVEINSEAKTSGKDLVVLLERNRKVEQMCLTTKNITPRASIRRHGYRIGYEELLNRAKLSKSF